MKKLLIFLPIITFIFFGSTFLLGNYYISHKFINSSQTEGSSLQAIVRDRVKEFTFTSEFNNLNIIYIRLKNIQIKNTDPFNFSLLDEHGNILREITISGRNIGDDDWVRFQFPLVVEAKNKDFKVVLSSSTRLSNNAVYAYVNKVGEPSYKVFSVEPFSDSFFYLMGSFWSRYINDWGFVTLYTMLLVLVILSLFKKRV